MKNMSLSLLAALSLSTITFSAPAFAQVPDSVMQPYKAYNAAIQSGNVDSAIKNGKAAWKAAEKALGDSKTTGDLAFNYGYMEANQGDPKSSLKPLKRSVELASLHTENASAIQIERQIELSAALLNADEPGKAQKQVKSAIKFSEAQGLGSTAFAGELHVLDAKACNALLYKKIRYSKLQTGTKINKATDEKGFKKANKKCGRLAERAIAVFETEPANKRLNYEADAYDLAGFGREMDDQWFEAAMFYQKGRLLLEETLPRDNPKVAGAIGRWLQARNYLKRKKQLDYALANGLCKCWPYADYAEKLQPTSKVGIAGVAAARNYGSGGYSMVKYDVSDSGVVENAKVLSSWPGDVYDKPSLKAVRQYTFSAKTTSEPTGYRKSLIEPIVYSFYGDFQ